MLALSSSVYAQQLSLGLSFYSTYPSESLSTQCNTTDRASEHTTQCVEDVVSPELYVQALEDLNTFTTIAPFSGGNDYELLVANLSHQDEDAKHYSEFTLQWRGVEIDSFTAISSGNSSQEVAVSAVAEWLSHALSASIFSAPHLYGSIGASDYIGALKLPQTIHQFERTGIQLYPDPFQGIVTRYVHNEFEDAIVDVSVFPFMAQTLHPSSALLIDELENDHQLAQSVADQRDLKLVAQNPISPFAAHNGNSGFKLHLVANGLDEEPVFATSYAFFAKDKVVKVSTTFPEGLSDEFTNVLIANIEVPDESKLMSEVRLLLLEADKRQ